MTQSLLSMASSPSLFILYVSDISRPIDAQVNLSQFTDNIPIWAQVPGICSINLRLQKYLNQILTRCDRWRIKLNARKTHLINFSRRKLFSDTSVTLYGQLPKVTPLVKFLGVTINSHRKGMLCKQNEYCKTKFNQCYPVNPSTQIFCKVIHGLYL